MIKKLTHFIANDLWKLDVDEMSKSRFLLIQQLRIFVLAIRGFNENSIMLQYRPHQIVGRISSRDIHIVTGMARRLIMLL